MPPVCVLSLTLLFQHLHHLFDPLLLPYRFLGGMSWRDAPVELARSFHKRTTELMKQVLKAGSGMSGVLGKVTNWVVRYEVSGQDLNHALQRLLACIGYLS